LISSVNNSGGHVFGGKADGALGRVVWEFKIPSVGLIAVGVIIQIIRCGIDRNAARRVQ
jgi:hypothetical protein